MDEVIVVDLEGTCCEDGAIPKDERETIEIGAVLVGTDGKVVSEFSELVRPVRHPKLTAFCTGLTGITQADVDGADGFPDVWGRFLGWTDGRKRFCSWGGYDRDQFLCDCGWHKLPVWFDEHCDLVKTYGRKRGHRRAMWAMGIEPQGRHHRGVDDARNIAATLVAMLANGKGMRWRKIVSSYQSQ